MNDESIEGYVKDTFELGRDAGRPVTHPEHITKGRLI